MGADEDHGAVEWLDLGSPRRRPAGPGGPAPGRFRNPLWWYGLAAVVLVGVFVAVRLGQQPAAKKPAARAHVSPSVSPSVPASDVPAGDSPAPASAGPASGPGASFAPVTNLGHPIAAVPASWVLYARGDASLARLDLAAGRVTITAVPALQSSGPVSFAALTGGVVIRPLDEVPGYVVPTGKAAHQSAALLGGEGPALPGPDSTQVWVPSGTGAKSTMTLVGLDGKATHTAIPVPENSGTPTSDDAGYILVSGIGGVYDARPNGLRRITTGELLAVGPTSWLVYECDSTDRCGTSVIDRANGTRRVLNVAVDTFATSGGEISPDGRTAAVLTTNAAGASSLELLDLVTGHLQPTTLNVSFDEGFGAGTFVWSPDSRELFAADSSGGLDTVSATTGAVTPLKVSLPAMREVTLSVGAR